MAARYSSVRFSSIVHQTIARPESHHATSYRACFARPVPRRLANSIMNGGAAGGAALAGFASARPLLALSIATGAAVAGALSAHHDSFGQIVTEPRRSGTLAARPSARGDQV